MRTEIPLWPVRIGQSFLHWPVLCRNNKKVNGISMTTDFFESAPRPSRQRRTKAREKADSDWGNR